MTPPRVRGAAIAAALSALACACSGDPSPGIAGDAERGRTLLHDYGCGGCHRIPGVDGAGGDVGPPLVDLRRRVYLAGTLSNAPDVLARWIRSPQTFKRLTAMPNVGASERDADDMTAYLWRH